MTGHSFRQLRRDSVFQSRGLLDSAVPSYLALSQTHEGLADEIHAQRHFLSHQGSNCIISNWKLKGIGTANTIRAVYTTTFAAGPLIVTDPVISTELFLSPVFAIVPKQSLEVCGGSMGK